MPSRRALVVAVVLVLVVEHLVPFGRLALYPLTLLATWVHETGHGVAALLVGGQFERLQIFADASGVAWTREAPGWPAAIVSLAGLLAPPLVGALLFAVARGPRRARASLALLALALAATLALWVRSPAGLVVVPLDLVAIALVAWRGSPAFALLAAQGIAVVLALDTLGRMLGYAFMATAHVGGADRPSDIANVVAAVGGTRVAWGLAVSAAALALLALGLWLAWRPSVTTKRPR